MGNGGRSVAQNCRQTVCHRGSAVWRAPLTDNGRSTSPWHQTAAKTSSDQSTAEQLGHWVCLTQTSTPTPSPIHLHSVGLHIALPHEIFSSCIPCKRPVRQPTALILRICGWLFSKAFHLAIHLVVSLRFQSPIFFISDSLYSVFLTSAGLYSVRHSAEVQVAAW